jgi:predicted HicB family RNase H-like nuclease
MNKILNIRVEESRLEKLRALAKERKKSMTQLVEDWIDRLPNPVKNDSEA